MQISLVGVGMGNIKTLTIGGYQAIMEAEFIIGAKRLLQSLPKTVTAKKESAITPSEIHNLILQNANLGHICVVFSGDIGFYSGAKKLLPLLQDYTVHTYCGITTVQYFSSKIARAWEQVKLVSAHGQDCDIISHLCSAKEVFFLTGGKITPTEIISTLCQSGLGKSLVYVGERLSYEEETITADLAENLLGRTFHSLSAVWVVHEEGAKRNIPTAHLQDTQFARGNVPMTKQEVRWVIASLLRAKQGDVVYDIGAGTGSVSVEIGMLSSKIKVYAVEVSPEACALVQENVSKFSLCNVKLVTGKAPEAMEALPAPDCVFIGGSKGNLSEILSLVLKKNPQARIVMSAIALETLAQAITACKELGLSNMEVTQLQVSKTKPVGSYHMLMGQNPTFLISAGGEQNGN